MRSSPANASVICVPTDASWKIGIVIRAVKDRYFTRSPIVIVPSRMAAPPISIIATPLAPTTSDENAMTADVPVIDFATLRNSRCAPFANTSSSRFSAVYALTMRTPPRDSASRPVTSALIWLRSRKSGRSRLNAVAMPMPKVLRISDVTTVKRQLMYIRTVKAIVAVRIEPVSCTRPVPTMFRTPSASLMIREMSTPVLVESK